MYRVSKSFKFCAAHRLESSFTLACQEIHGHNYTVEVILESASLNKDGMVIDFGKIKGVVKPFIDKLDHSFMIMKQNEDDATDNVIHLDCNPTSENIARSLYINIEAILGKLPPSSREKSKSEYKRIVHLVKVRVYETDSSWSEYIG
jgi:6-pyruvoyltetrahydropterin/6-carboxytetrahydropterin synthase